MNGRYLFTKRTMIRNLIHICTVLLIISGFGILLPSIAFAVDGSDLETIIDVTTTEDELNTDGDCSLREAIEAVNNGVVVDSCLAGVDNNVINLPNGIYLLTMPGGLSINANVTIIGSDKDLTIVNGGAISRVFFIDHSTVDIKNLTITNGREDSQIHSVSGAGIWNLGGTLTLENTIVKNNFAQTPANCYGGGIRNSGVLILINGTVTGNEVIADMSVGSGILNDVYGTFTMINSTVSNNKGGSGIYALQATVTNITGSTVSGNSSGLGGGFFNQGDTTIINSTFSGNTALSGGAIYQHEGSLILTNVTLTDNTSSSYLGKAGIAYGWIGIVEIKNTIIANNHNGKNCSSAVGGINSLGNNLDDDSSCLFNEPSDITGNDPLLGSLHNNGGVTLTHALLLNSPAIDSGDNVSCPETDQRGYLRDVACDIGSYEYNATPPFISPDEAIQDLINEINDINLQNGISQSFEAKLESALQALSDINENNDIAAINSLEAFINAVEAQREKKISNEQADILIDAAQRIIDYLSSQ